MSATPKVDEVVMDCGNGRIIVAFVNNTIGTAMMTGPDAVAAMREMLDTSTFPNVLKHLNRRTRAAGPPHDK